MYLDKKAIALINAPKSCGECCFQKGLTVYGYACGIAKTMNKDTRNRPDWCPLIPLPKRHTAPKTATGYEIGYEDGWNDCLDKIAGHAVSFGTARTAMSMYRFLHKRDTMFQRGTICAH